MPELKEAPQLTVALSAADANHWNIVNDPIFPSCLDKFKARHEASLASGAAKLTRRPSSQGESSTPTQELPLATWPQPPPTPTLEWQEVNEKVAEVMDQVHNLHLKTLQEMGWRWRNSFNSILRSCRPSASDRKVPSVSSQPEDGGAKPDVSEPKESIPSTPKPSQ